MKTAKKGFCFFLALCLLVSALAVTAFAKDERFTYTAVGDSIAAGFGLPDYHDGLEWWENSDTQEIAGSYASILRDRLAGLFGTNNIQLNMDAHIAWRSTELLNVLAAAGHSFTDPGFDTCETDYYEQEFGFDPSAGNWCTTKFFRNAFGLIWKDGGLVPETVGATIWEHLSESDLVTVNYGANDIFSYALAAVLGKYGSPLLSGSVDLNALLKVFADALVNAPEGQRRTILGDFVNAAELGLARYQHNLPLMIQAIESATEKTDAAIAVIGVKSPIINPIVIGDLNIDLATYLDPLIVRANAVAINECAKSDRAVYVDVGGTTYWGFSQLLNGFSLDDGYGSIVAAIQPLHPDPNGHAYMAECIYSALLPGFSAPSGVEATPDGKLGKPQISWNTVPGAKGYIVYRSLFKGAGYHPVKIVSGGSATDLTAVAGLSYYYKVATLINRSGTLQSVLSAPTDSIKTASIFSALKWNFSVK